MRKLSKGLMKLGTTLFMALFLVGLTSSAGQAATVTASDKAVSTSEDVAKSITPSATGSRGETFVFSVYTSPTHGSVSTSGSTFTYTPATNYNGSDSFMYKATGSSGAVGTATISITVNPVNDSPVITTMVPLETTENVPVNFTVRATDVDGNTLTCSAGSASGGKVTVDSNTCIGTFTPASAFVGEASATVRVSDGQASVTTTFGITVLDTNFAPTATDAAVSVTEDVSKTFNLVASDQDGDALSYNILTQPAHGSVSLTGSVATYSPSANYYGNDSFTYQVSDGKALSNLATVTMTIAAMNDIPVGTATDLHLAKNQRTTLTLTATDADNDALTFGTASQPSHGTLQNISNGVYNYTPDENFEGVDSFSYFIKDGIAYVTATVNVNVSRTASTPASGVGTIAWQKNMGATTISGQPAFANGKIYLGAYQNGASIYALSAAGELLQDIYIGMHVESAMMVLGDKLYANTIITSEDADSGTVNNYSVNQRRGTLSFDLDENGTIADGFVCSNQSQDQGRDGSPGRNESGNIIYAADVHYPGANSLHAYLTAFNASNCATLQSIELPGWTYSSPLFYPDFSTSSKKDGLVIVGSQSDTGGILQAFQSDTEGTLTTTPAWSIAADEEFGRGASAIPSLGMIFGATPDTVYGIRASDGAVLWQNTIGGAGLGTVSVGADNRTLYFLNGTHLWALNATTGEALWVDTVASNGSTVAVGDHGIYLVGDNRVLALDTQGRELWNLPLSEAPIYGYASLNPENGQLVFAAGTSIYSIKTESTGLASTSDWPSYRADADNSGLPQTQLTGDDPVEVVTPSDTFYQTSKLGTTDTLEYCNIDGVSLQMDLHWPIVGTDDRSLFPVLIQIHGGGYTGGDRGDNANYTKSLTESGFLVATVDYRLAPTYKFPAQIEDLKCAVRYLRANAYTYHLDPDNIGAFGGSAGGHLAALLGTADDSYGWDDVGQNQGVSSKVQAVVDLYGATNFTAFFTGFSRNLAYLLVGSRDLSQQIFKDLSPYYDLSADDAHFLVIHGVLDEIVPISQSEAFVAQATALGVPASLIRIENANHGFAAVGGATISPSLNSIMQSMADFFDEELR